MCMEKCYDSYVKMGGKSPQYVVPDARKRSQTAPDDGEDLYEDMDGGKSSGRKLLSCCIQGCQVLSWIHVPSAKRLMF